MKRIFLALSLVFTLALVGCSSGSEYRNVSVSEIQKSIESSNLLLEQSVSLDIIESDFFNDVDEKIIEGFIIKASNNLRLEDIIVIKAETENVDAIYEAIESYKKNMIVRSFGAGYGSDENANIATSTITAKKGNYVYLVSAPNTNEIEEKIIDIIKK